MTELMHKAVNHHNHENPSEATRQRQGS